MTYIIAEIGVNHNGDIGQAFRLMEAAKEAGADAVKFQLFDSLKLWGDERVRDLELDQSEITSLKWKADSMGIDFLCTPFDRESLAFLVMLGVKQIKVASGMLRKHGFLDAVRETQLPVILSTGMATLSEIQETLNALGHNFPARYSAPITILHCTSAYPCPLEDVNLRALDAYLHQWGSRCRIGYSDHTSGITVAIAAVARGATVIEKHLTLDQDQDGPDHKASIEPHDFKRMVEAIREVDQCLGDGKKQVMPSEKELREIWK